MSEWKECTIGDIGTVVGGATPLTTDSRNYDNGNIPWITPKDLSDYHERYISRGERNITETGLKSCATQMLPKNTVLFSSRAPIGYVAIASNEVCTNQGFKSVVPNKDVDYLFLYYLLKYNKEMIEGMGSGTTFKEVSKKTMEQIKVCVPKDISVQRKIAGILDSLDSKIELNNQINRNLEEQAQAIFKSWFIDFEPFGGEMPKGWINGKLSDLGTVVGGGTPSKAKNEYYTHNGIAWITPKDLSLHPNKFTSKGEIDITQEGYANSSAKIMPEGTILFSSRAPIGYISIAQNELCTNQGFKSVIPKVNVGTPYVYFYLKNHTEEIENKASGSTFKEASSSLMNGLEAIIPSNQILSKFNSLCNPIFEQQESLELEN